MEAIEKMERLHTFITKNQKQFLVDNSITTMAKNWGYKGKTQSDHVRDALNLYIETESKKEVMQFEKQCK